MTTIETGDCLEVMRRMPDNSVDAVVTDPPYGLEFMGKDWDAPWKTDRRQVFDGSLTDVRENPFGRSKIRYGSGASYGAGAEHMRAFQAWATEIFAECLRVLKPGGHLLAFGGSRTYHRLACAVEDAGFEMRDQIMWVYGSGFPKSLDVSKAIDKAAGVERKRVPGPKSGGMAALNKGNAAHGYRDDAYYENGNMMLSSEPATDAARQWQGWGTALKPAHEPIAVARKPLIGTVAENVLAHGTGALNIDACRVGGNVDEMRGRSGTSATPGGETTSYRAHNANGGVWSPNDLGRWPANLIHDGSDEVTALAGDAARFFYCAKASRADRSEGNTHPTVKPTDLMRYLCRLVTPPGGIVLDPFMGSGSTGKAAVLEGFGFIGIEKDAEYVKIAEARIAQAWIDRVSSL